MFTLGFGLLRSVMQLRKKEQEHKREMKQLKADREASLAKVDDLVNRLAIAEKEKAQAWCQVQSPTWEYQGNTGNWVAFAVSMLSLREQFLFSFS